MRNLKFLLLAMLLAPAFAFAQHMQDAIYLKDGSILKGTIVEEVPGQSYKIESKDGNVYAVQLDEVEKLTRERKPQRSYGHGHWGPRKWHNDTTVYERGKGYFFEAQGLIENRQGGGRLINGYRFNRYAQLGVGIGVDFLMSSPWNERLNGLDKKALAATYPSVFLYFQSESPFGKRVRPYFAIEAGYTMAIDGDFNTRPSDDFGNVIMGGPMAGLGVGFKIRPRRKMPHLSILFNINYKRLEYERIEEILDPSGSPIDRFTVQEIADVLVPGIRLGIGF